MLGSVHPISASQERRFLPAAPVGRLNSENRHQSATPPRARAQSSQGSRRSPRTRGSWCSRCRSRCRTRCRTRCRRRPHGEGARARGASAPGCGWRPPPWGAPTARARAASTPGCGRSPPPGANGRAAPARRWVSRHAGAVRPGRRSGCRRSAARRAARRRHASKAAASATRHAMPPRSAAPPPRRETRGPVTRNLHVLCLRNQPLETQRWNRGWFLSRS